MASQPHGGTTKSTDNYLGGIARNHLHTATTPGADTLTGISEPGVGREAKPMSAETGGMSNSVYSNN